MISCSAFNENSVFIPGEAPFNIRRKEIEVYEMHFDIPNVEISFQVSYNR